MSKIIFLTEQEFGSLYFHKKVTQDLGAKWFNFKNGSITEKVKENDPGLFVVFIQKLSVQSRKELKQLMTEGNQVPTILIGVREDLNAYFNMTDATILKYITTPISDNELFDIIKDTAQRINVL